MKPNQKMTKEEYRILLKEVIESRKAPPSPIVIKERLWKIRNITA